ncbi:hypothetical protein CDIK_3945 [Cucumispora dikerogammari]|nr:hypothetical protein CDIK_3945 [Cucumispora dikerogammari]
MFRQIISTQDFLSLDSQDYPRIDTQPSIINIEQKKTNFLPYMKKTSSSYKYIETVIDFQNTPLLNSFDDTAYEITKNIKIFTIDTIDRGENNPIVSRDSFLSEERLQTFKDLETKSLRVGLTNKLTVSLRPRYEYAENPLIVYLKNNSSKAFKLIFSFKCNAYEYIHSTVKVILHKIEEKTRPLEEMMNKQIKNVNLAVSLIQTRCDQAQFLRWLLEKEKIYKEITEHIKSVKDLVNVPEAIKVNTVHYLELCEEYAIQTGILFERTKKISDLTKKILYPHKSEQTEIIAKYASATSICNINTMFNELSTDAQLQSKNLCNENIIIQDPTQEINKLQSEIDYIYSEIKILRSNRELAFYEIIDQIKEFLRKILIEELNISQLSTYLRSIILDIFYEEIEEQVRRDLFSLSVIVENINKKAKQKIHYRMFETKPFKLNEKGNKLLEVQYEKKTHQVERDTIEITTNENIIDKLY